MSIVWQQAARFRADSRASTWSHHRITLELTYPSGCLCEEVAAILDCPMNTVKTRMCHARDRLRSILPALAIPVGSDS